MTQIKPDLSDIPDWHHRQHHGDWLTVVDVEMRVGTRYVCRCAGGYPVYVDAENVTKTRQVPETPVGPRKDPSYCDKGR